MAKLTAEYVANLINTRITYKPGWSFRCTDDYYSPRVSIHWDQLETNPSNLSDDGEWGDDKSPNSEHFAIDLDDVIDETDVCRLVLEHAIYLEARMLQHEAREFFRVKPVMTWSAPFHPHHTIGMTEGKNGIANWRETSHRQLGSNSSLPDL